MNVSEHIEVDERRTRELAPVIECADMVKAGEWYVVKVTVPDALTNPGIPGDRLRWISLYFQPDGEKVPSHVSLFDFTSEAGAAPVPVRKPRDATTSLRGTEPGTLFAVVHCQVRGILQTSKHITVNP